MDTKKAWTQFALAPSEATFAPFYESTKRLVGTFPSEPAAAALRAQALMRAWHAMPSAGNRTAVEESISTLDQRPRPPN